MKTKCYQTPLKLCWKYLNAAYFMFMYGIRQTNQSMSSQPALVLAGHCNFCRVLKVQWVNFSFSASTWWIL